jgi:hypothetical protein
VWGASPGTAEQSRKPNPYRHAPRAHNLPPTPSIPRRDGARPDTGVDVRPRCLSGKGTDEARLSPVGPVRSGAPAGTVALTSAGPVPVRAPRPTTSVLTRPPGSGRRSVSAILPAWARKSPRVAGAGAGVPARPVHQRSRAGAGSSPWVPAAAYRRRPSHGSPRTGRARQARSMPAR